MPPSPRQGLRGVRKGACDLIRRKGLLTMLAPKDPKDYKQWQLDNLRRSQAQAPAEHVAVSLTLLASELGVREQIGRATDGIFAGSTRNARGESGTDRAA